MNVSTLTVLLVCVILECAHAATLQWGWEQFQSRSKRSARYGTSVVENWNSVCEVVCGAGYGGLGCGAQCDSPTNPNATSGAIIALREMCPILCSNKLGGSNCKCAEDSELDKATVETNRDLLCSDSCRFRYFQLSGCTVCSAEGRDTSHGVDKSSGGSEEYRNKSDSTEAERSSEDLTTENDDALTDEDSTTEQDTTTEEDTTEDTTTEITTTTSTTTTTTPTTTKSTTTTTQASTTLDWSQICEVWCRNGEGGAACNCDIPPFF